MPAPGIATLFSIFCKFALLKSPLLAGLSNLRTLTKLHTLNLWNCLHVTVRGLQVLSCLTNVADLTLRGCCQITDSSIPAVAHLTGLTRLDFRACEKMTGAATTSDVFILLCML